jgi:hypothetical protein
MGPDSVEGQPRLLTRWTCGAVIRDALSPPMACTASAKREGLLRANAAVGSNEPRRTWVD